MNEAYEALTILLVVVLTFAITIMWAKVKKKKRK